MKFFILIFAEIWGKDCMKSGVPLMMGEYDGDVGKTKTGRTCQIGF